jgi:hypothetical protein
LFRILNEEPRPLRELVEGVPPELEQLLCRALDKQRNARFPSALDTARALLPFVGPWRQLPGLSLTSTPLVHATTLAEDEPDEPRLAAVENAPTRSAERPRGSTRRWATAAGAFVLGAGLSALLRGGPVAAPEPTAPPLARAAVTSPEPPAPIPLPATAATATSSSPSPEASTNAVLKKPRAGATARPISSIPFSSTEHPGRLDPPQPTFDGRNPYRP